MNETSKYHIALHQDCILYVPVHFFFSQRKMEILQRNSRYRNVDITGQGLNPTVHRMRKYLHQKVCILNFNFLLHLLILVYHCRFLTFKTILHFELPIPPEIEKSRRQSPPRRRRSPSPRCRRSRSRSPRSGR